MDKVAGVEAGGKDQYGKDDEMNRDDFTFSERELNRENGCDITKVATVRVYVSLVYGPEAPLDISELRDVSNARYGQGQNPLSSDGVILFTLFQKEKSIV